MNAFGNEREELLMHQHLPTKAFAFSCDHDNQANSTHAQNSGASVTFFRFWSYGMSYEGKDKYPEFRGA